MGGAWVVGVGVGRGPKKSFSNKKLNCKKFLKILQTRLCELKKSLGAPVFGF